MKVIFTVGLPASGKSTWAINFCKKNKDWVRVNRDDLRNMRGEYWIPKQEDMITHWHDFIVLSALKNGKNVIVDNVNLNKKYRNQLCDLISEKYPNTTFELEKFTHISLEECIKRDKLRANSVGEDVIRKMYKKYFPNSVNNVVYEEDKTLPHCVIFDVDGTLAKMHNRGPYDWDRVGDDLVNESIFKLNQYIGEYQGNLSIFIFTGRDGCCFEETKKWLDFNGVFYDDIFIRPRGNLEKDSIIKKRMFEQNIRGKFYCQFWVDDRLQVVNMVRKELGITCLQVDYGDF